MAAETGVFAGSGPSQKAQVLDGLVAGNGVYPVSRLDTPHQCQDFVGGQIEGMKREAEVFVLLQGEEAKGAVGGPLQGNLFTCTRNHRLNKSIALV
jgi:hypothetical protein